jgi:mannitol-1-phosphate 5-dehydrogenase
MRGLNAVVFGAGKMACGLLGPLLHWAEYDTVFVARRPEVVDTLNRYGGYRLTIAGNIPHDVAVRRCRAVTTADDAQVVEAVAQADLVLLGVGIDNVRAVAPLIARGLWQRSQTLAVRPLNVIACENLPGAGAYLRHLIVSSCPLDQGLAVETAGGFSAALTRRIMTGGGLRNGELWFRVSGPPELSIDVKGLRGAFPRIAGVRFTEDFSALVLRKLYTLNLGQAVAAYLGHRAGCSYVHEAAAHPAVAPIVRGALSEASSALQAEFPRQSREILRDAEGALAEIANAGLADTIQRVARSPRRKLSSLERLVGPARLAHKHGLPCNQLCLGVAAAIAYDHPADPEAQAVQETLRTEGIEKVLTVDCGLLPHEPLARAVKEQWRSLVAPDLEEAMKL